jgi:hypothetical protein
LSRECKSGGIHSVREISLVTGISRKVDHTPHDKEKRNRGCSEEHEDVSPLVTAVALKGSLE